MHTCLFGNDTNSCLIYSHRAQWYCEEAKMFEISTFFKIDLKDSWNNATLLIDVSVVVHLVMSCNSWCFGFWCTPLRTFTIKAVEKFSLSCIYIKMKENPQSLSHISPAEVVSVDFLRRNVASLKDWINIISVWILVSCRNDSSARGQSRHGSFYEPCLILASSGVHTLQLSPNFLMLLALVPSGFIRSFPLWPSKFPHRPPTFLLYKFGKMISVET